VCGQMERRSSFSCGDCRHWQWCGGYGLHLAMEFKLCALHIIQPLFDFVSQFIEICVIFALFIIGPLSYSFFCSNQPLKKA
jgi:hypothetical protein